MNNKTDHNMPFEEKQVMYMMPIGLLNTVRKEVQSVKCRLAFNLLVHGKEVKTR